MKNLKTIVACTAILAWGCSPAGDLDTEAKFHELCTRTSEAEGIPAVACKVLSDTVERFVQDPNQKRGAYAMAAGQVYYRSNPAGYQAAWRILVDDFQVDPALLDPETRAIVRGRLNDVFEAMWTGAGVEFGGDVRGFRQILDEQMGSPEARAYMDERADHYLRELTGG
jgi:hypothetical protein